MLAWKGIHSLLDMPALQGYRLLYHLRTRHMDEKELQHFDSECAGSLVEWAARHAPAGSDNEVAQHHRHQAIIAAGGEI